MGSGERTAGFRPISMTRHAHSRFFSVSKTSGSIRREMDRHCITVCTMKLVNYPFYQVGCRTDAFLQLTSPLFPLSPHTCT
ncbi:hypothetical protein Taro_008987 [Colocasia esculenta]|uniref:Uncharacterized protein n=1 Tax=Colocasia esculenta TaxID=4460 RepID=A0A843TV74_COLES|nr:hypothetical protein [Colocasia esculenta]